MNYRNVLEEIKPADAPIVKVVLTQIKEELNKQGIKANIVPGGSYAKKTHVGKNFDCDTFLQFSNKEDINKLFKIIEPVAKKNKTTVEVVHGSRDYASFAIGNISFEIIPAILLKDPKEAENIMDLSPYHVNWFQKELKKKPKGFENEIKLFKQFLKAPKVYGAESYIQGFSGHVVDILVFYYGGFLKTVKAIAKWPKTTDKKYTKEIIDFHKAYKGKDVMFFMNASKTYAPLIVVDPIIPDRNAAAAICEKCYNDAIDISKKFVKKPSEQFFKVIPITKEYLQKKYKKPVICFEVTPYPGKKDVVGSKIVKVLDWAGRLFEENGFEVVHLNWSWEESAKLFVVLNNENIPKTYRKYGPKSELIEAVSDFKKAHRDAKEDTKRKQYFVEKTRAFVTAQSLASQIICKDQYIIERVSKIKTIL